MVRFDVIVPAFKVIYVNLCNHTANWKLCLSDRVITFFSYDLCFLTKNVIVVSILNDLKSFLHVIWLNLLLQEKMYYCNLMILNMMSLFTECVLFNSYLNRTLLTRTLTCAQYFLFVNLFLGISAWIPECFRLSVSAEKSRNKKLTDRRLGISISKEWFWYIWFDIYLPSRIICREQQQ